MAEAAAVHQFNSILLGGRGGTVSLCFCFCLCLLFISISRSLSIGYSIVIWIYGPCKKVYHPLSPACGWFALNCECYNVKACLILVWSFCKCPILCRHYERTSSLGFQNSERQAISLAWLVSPVLMIFYGFWSSESRATQNTPRRISMAKNRGWKGRGCHDKWYYWAELDSGAQRIPARNQNESWAQY